MFFRTV